MENALLTAMAQDPALEMETLSEGFIPSLAHRVSNLR